MVTNVVHSGRDATLAHEVEDVDYEGYESLDELNSAVSESNGTPLSNYSPHTEVEYVTAAEAFGHQLLEDSLIVHRSKLEIDKATALENEEMPRISPRPQAYNGPPLQLVPHRTRLEQDREEALKQDMPRISPRPLSARLPEQPALELKVHKSRLELEKEAAKDKTNSIVPGSLSDMKIRKSRLQLEKEAAMKMEAKRIGKDTRKEYEGPTLGEILTVKRKSKLELEKEAAKLTGTAAQVAAAAAASKPLDRQSSLGSVLSQSISPMKKIEHEMEMLKSAPSSPVKCPVPVEYDGPSLGESLTDAPLHQSRLQKEKAEMELHLQKMTMVED